MRRKLAAGNWKMNGLGAALDEATSLAESHANTATEAATEIVLCPPATLVREMARRCQGTAVVVGGQDCHEAASGAHTGDISAEMLADAGAKYVILGHSERRAAYGESSDLVRHKARRAWQAGLRTIICIGESEDQRQTGKTLDVIGEQLAESVPHNASGETLVIAYEPIWAIGTGRIPTLDDIGEVHEFIRAQLKARFGGDAGDAVRLLYGGSMKPDNAAEIVRVANVDGGLVGGASLKAADFGRIIDAING